MMYKNFTLRCPDHPKTPLKQQEQNSKYICVHCSFFVQQRDGTFFTNYKPEDSLRFSSSPNTSKVVSRNESSTRVLYRKLTSLRSKSLSNFNDLEKKFKNKKVLVIGGGELGIGDFFIESETTIRLDVYQGLENSLLADAHAIPFANDEFDLVIIQAVLEHLLSPSKAVEEIFRVLKDGGFVYSEVPFLQSVHEGIFDFTRYTMTGHSVLFKDFQIKEFGVVSGSFTSLNWSIRDAFRSIGFGMIGKILFLVFRLLGIFLPKQKQVSACNGTFILAQKDCSKGGSILAIEDLRKFSGL